MSDNRAAIAERIFILAHIDYDEYAPNILIGPPGMTGEGFREACSAALPEAARTAIVDAGDCWAGWDGIVKAMVRILCERGFHLATPPQHGYFGSSIIRADGERADDPLDAATLALFEEHNKAVEVRLEVRLSVEVTP